MNDMEATSELASSNISSEAFAYILNKIFADCSRCKWNKDDVCVNDKSRLCCDFVRNNDVCKLFEKNNVMS